MELSLFLKKKENNRRRYRKAEKNGKNYKIVSSKYHSISKKVTQLIASQLSIIESNATRRLKQSGNAAKAPVLKFLLALAPSGEIVVE